MPAGLVLTNAVLVHMAQQRMPHMGYVYSSMYNKVTISADDVYTQVIASRQAAEFVSVDE